MPTFRNERVRLLPGEPLPNYAHVPGQTPHPLNDPKGHSYGQTNIAEAVDSAGWERSATYLRGLDLFNFGYYWEAHEAWEGLWHAACRKGEVADFLKGLIQLAVAGVKRRQGLEEGVRAHARRAAELWRGTGQGRTLGLCVAELIATAEGIERDGWPEVPPVLLPVAEG